MRLLIATALLAATAAPALADTRNFPVGRFDRVASDGPWDVRVFTGRGPAVRASGDRQVLDRLTVEVINGELRIGARSGSFFRGWNWGNRPKTVIDVNVPMVNAVTLNGPGDLSVDRVRTPDFAARLNGPGNVNLPAVAVGHITLDLSGPGNINVTGRAADGRARVSGPGDIRGRGLTMGDVDVQLSGPGNITLNAMGNATGGLSGPGDITLTGHPRCTIRKSGPGSVRC